MSGAADKPEGAGDPSMEDILASIRRILNDGEGSGEGGSEGGPGAAADGPVAHAAPETSTHAEPLAADDVFLLDQTMLIEEQAPMPPEPPPSPSPPVRPPAYQPPPPEPPQADDYSQLDAGEPLLAPAAAAATSASLGALVRVVSQRQTPVYRGGPTLEDMVRDEIKPLVKAWLDENLAPMVERMVRAEIDRVSKGSG